MKCEDTIVWGRKLLWSVSSGIWCFSLFSSTTLNMPSSLHDGHSWHQISRRRKQIQCPKEWGGDHSKVFLFVNKQSSPFGEHPILAGWRTHEWSSFLPFDFAEIEVCYSYDIQLCRKYQTLVFFCEILGILNPIHSFLCHSSNLCFQATVEELAEFRA